jgi:hypothetical protein
LVDVQLIVDVPEYQAVSGDTLTFSVGFGGGGVGGVGEDPLLHDTIIAIPATIIKNSIFFNSLSFLFAKIENQRNYLTAVFLTIKKQKQNRVSNNPD